MWELPIAAIADKHLCGHEVVKPEVVQAVTAQDIEDGVVLYSMSHPRPPWWKRPWSAFQCWRARRTMAQYTITEEIDIDETDWERPGPLDHISEVRK